MKRKLSDVEGKFSDSLREAFGKDTFTEEELTKEFYVDLMVKCSQFFRNSKGEISMDDFWSEKTKEFLLQKK